MVGERWVFPVAAVSIVVAAAIIGAIFLAPVLTVDPPQWREVLSINHPTRVSTFDENTLTWNTMTLETPFLHRFNITGHQWKIFIGGTANESAEWPLLAVGLFIIYTNGSFYDGIPLDLFILRDFRPVDATISERSAFPATYQIIIFHQGLESFGITITEFA